MSKTQLRLDFSLDTIEERQAFLDKYLKDNPNHWSDSDIQMMGNYLLWGKEKNNKSAASNLGISIETKHNTWTRKKDESLDALLEQPTFNEVAVFSEVPIKVAKTKFSREEALRDAPDNLKETFRGLFEQIDRLDLTLNYYDIKTGKREKEPREELLKRFTQEEQEQLKKDATRLNQFNYLKKRHLLAELRNQQYALRDNYVTHIQRTAPPTMNLQEDVTEFENNIPVFPLGVFTKNSFMRLIFKPKEELNPYTYTEKELNTVSKFLWAKKKEKEKHDFQIYFDFTNEEHLGELFQFYLDLENEENELTSQLIETVKYYINFSDLNDIQREILNMKINKKTNEDIRAVVNEKYDKHYAVNYISTIFRKKIIPCLIDAANHHMEVIENLFFEEEFKKCICCGRILLINEKNFMHKSRSKDGFNNKCKTCEKEARKRRGNGK